MKCWGYNRNGELGDGASLNRLNPVRVAGLSGVTAIAVGGRHSCARTRNGGVKCWGYNGWGQLGDGTTVSRRRPVRVSHLIGRVTTIAAGARHTCASTARGGVDCWGNNWWGQLGDGSVTSRTRPVAVLGFGRPK